MYCSKCGNLLNENGTCSNCDVASTRVTVANPVSSNRNVSQKTSLAKCAWFASVSPILWFVIRELVRTIIDNFISDYYDPFLGTFESAYYFLMGTQGLLMSILQWAISFIFFQISFSKINKDIKNKVLLVFIVPSVLIEILSIIVFSGLQYILMGLNAYPIALEMKIGSVQIITEIVFAIGIFLVSVISYFVCSKYLSKFDLSKEIKPEEKTVTDSAPVITNYPPQENNGYIQQNVISQKSEKSRGVAAVLCFFLGALGIHRFYVGKIGTGLLWMFTAGLFGIGAFIDFIIIICGSFKDADDRTL